MNTTFILSGGAGRVINAIPALEKYQKLNPDDDFKIIVHGWEELFWSHPTLQKRTFGAHQKGLFDTFIKQSKIICPEPYHLNSFFNQKTNLVEAFDECINNTNHHEDLNHNCLHFSKLEQEKIKELVLGFKEDKKKKKLVVFQPFGSTVEIINKKPIDRSNRSLSMSDYYEIVKAIQQDAAVVYVSQPDFRHPNDKHTIPIDNYLPYIRTMMGIISECDFFVGVCSVGQHMARAFNKPGLILMGATSEKNFSYPDYFDIYRKKDKNPIYLPWRLYDTDVEFIERQNDGIMDFNTTELSEIINLIKCKVDAPTTLLSNNEKTSLGVRYE